MASVRSSKIWGVCWLRMERRQDARVVWAGFAEIGLDQGRAEWSVDGGLSGSGNVPVNEDEADVRIAVDGIELAVLDLDDDDGL